MNFSFDPDAEKEFELAINYHNECQTDLGFEFASEVFKSIDNILNFLEAWSKLSKNKRR
jgi:hypothetical protein